MILMFSHRSTELDALEGIQASGRYTLDWALAFWELRVGAEREGEAGRSLPATVMSQSKPHVSASPTLIGERGAGHPFHPLQTTSHHLSPLQARGGLIHLHTRYSFHSTS